MPIQMNLGDLAHLAVTSMLADGVRYLSVIGDTSVGRIAAYLPDAAILCPLTTKGDDTWAHGYYIVAIPFAVASYCADRLMSGLYGVRVHDTWEEATARIEEVTR